MALLRVHSVHSPARGLAAALALATAASCTGDPGAAPAPDHSGDGPAVWIGGSVPDPYRLDLETFDAFPFVEFTAADHGAAAGPVEGVLLRLVLERAGVEFGESLRGPRLAAYVLVEAADGYRAVFALPELDEAFGHGEVYLVARAAGEPLDPHTGPFRIVVPAETRQARWVRQVTAISVRYVDP